MILGYLTGLPGKVAIAIAAISISFASGYTYGTINAKAKARAEALAATISQLKEREATDAEIRNLDDAGLCDLLGGKWLPERGCE